MTPEQQAALLVQKMTLELDLNEAQQEQVHDLILNKVKKQRSAELIGQKNVPAIPNLPNES